LDGISPAAEGHRQVRSARCRQGSGAFPPASEPRHAANKPGSPAGTQRLCPCRQALRPRSGVLGTSGGTARKTVSAGLCEFTLSAPHSMPGKCQRDNGPRRSLPPIVKNGESPDGGAHRGPQVQQAGVRELVVPKADGSASAKASSTR
jgi:hypothetical protein